MVRNESLLDKKWTVSDVTDCFCVIGGFAQFSCRRM